MPCVAAMLRLCSGFVAAQARVEGNYSVESPNFYKETIPLRLAGLASTAAKPRQSLALGAARRVGETRSRWSACGFGRCAPCGPVRKAGRSRETARLGFVYSAARSPNKLVPLKRLYGRRRFAPARGGFRFAPPTVPARNCGASLNTRAVAYASAADASEPPLTSFASCAA